MLVYRITIATFRHFPLPNVKAAIFVYIQVPWSLTTTLQFAMDASARLLVVIVDVYDCYNGNGYDRYMYIDGATTLREGLYIDLNEREKN